MKFQKMLLTIFKWIMVLILSYPISVFAALISITPTVPFPATVATSSTTIATYTVTNITSRTPLTIIDQSDFPSALSIASTTCGGLIGPGASCIINVQLKAPASATTVTGTLKEWAKPSRDGVSLGIRVQVTNQPPPPPSTFVITPSVGSGGGGTISPSTPQTVTNGSSVVFTASSATGFEVGQWLVDGIQAQAGGTSFTLANITSNHTVEVDFNLTYVSIGGGQISGSGNPLLLATLTPGATQWGRFDFSSLGNAILRAAACSGLSCISAGSLNPPEPLVITSTDGGVNWTQTTFDIPRPGATLATVSVSGGTDPMFLAAGIRGRLYWSRNGTTFTLVTSSVTNNSNFRSVSCTGSDGNAVCVAVGEDQDFSPSSGLILVTQSGGTSWVKIDQIGKPPLNVVNCIGSGTNTFCVAAGISFATTPYIEESNDGGLTWTDSTILPSILNSTITGISCTNTGSANLCVLSGTDGTAPMLLANNGSSGAWQRQTINNSPSTGTLSGVSCTGSICVAVGANNDTSLPLIVTSMDGGSTWNTFTDTITGGPAPSTSGVFNDVSCKPNAGSVSCTAAGQDTGSNVPILATTSNNGVSWAYQSTGAAINGLYNAAG